MILSGASFEKRDVQLFHRELLSQIFPLSQWCIFYFLTSSNNVPTPTATTKGQEHTIGYRIIKTPSTFLAERKLRNDRESGANPDPDYERPTKIPRTSSNHDASSAYGKRRNFATDPASLRRAASLRSKAEGEANDDEARKPPIYPHRCAHILILCIFCRTRRPLCSQISTSCLPFQRRLIPRPVLAALMITDSPEG